MSNEAPDIQQGRFSYSHKVAGLFLPRHPELEAMHRSYTNTSEVEPAIRGYVSQLLRGWARYLEDDEVVALETNILGSSDLPSANGKQARLIKDKASRQVVGIRYNFLSDTTEPEAREISARDFMGMQIRERQQLVEQHPEILLIANPPYDGVFNKGVLPRAFIDVYGFGRGILAVRTPEGFLSPEAYTSALGFLHLLDHLRQLLDDTHIYSLGTGKRKGEVCLACRRVDP